MARRQVDMAVEEIRVEVVDDFLHPPSRCNCCSLRVPESSHPLLATGEVSTGIADAFPAFAASASTSALLSLRSSFIASLQSFASTDVSSWFPAARAAPRWRISLRIFQRQASLGGFRTLSLLRAVVKVFDVPVTFLVDVVHCGIFPKAG
ncbi:hypothetical protein RB195_017319 [Necator americanus]|uniref:Uncharacterized protein n=1 Tax=Necator americanus TaxID=51031 RepID=A0ABR1C5P3_NECAM